MKKLLLCAVAAGVLLGCVTGASAQAPATAAEAQAFVAQAETELAAMSEYAGRVAWMRNTDITFDSMWLDSRANAESTELGVRYAKGAARFDATPGIDPVTAAQAEAAQALPGFAGARPPGAATNWPTYRPSSIRLFDRQVHLQGQDPHPERRRGHHAREPRSGRAEGGVGRLALDLAGHAPDYARWSRSPTRDRANSAMQGHRRPMAVQLRHGPTPSPPRPTGCGSRSRPSTRTCTAMCGRG
jgi:hypothetical protein